MWLQREGSDEENTWLALDSNADPLLEIRLPAHASFGQADRDHVWYSEIDDLGVPWVVKARLIPNGEAGTRSGADQPSAIGAK